jgi:hypothetical protein
MEQVNWGRPVYSATQMFLNPSRRKPITYGTPLEVASSRGYTHVVDLLSDPTHALALTSEAYENTM